MSDHPLSFAQERLWFLWQLEPHTPVYNRPAFLRLTGELNHRALERVLNEIRRRHEVLRAVFVAENGRPRQAIEHWRYHQLLCEDLSHLPSTTRSEELRRQAVAAAQEPFDLARGPLMRAKLIALERDDHVLSLVFHHIVFDAWSSRILLSELAKLYRAFQNEADSSLSELPLQYSDYAAWQRRCDDEGSWSDEVAYWRNELIGPLPVLDLPMAGPRPALLTYNGAAYFSALPHDLAGRLSALCRDTQTTVFMALLAAFNILLYRYTRQKDIVIGCPIAGRTHLETESLLGCFINTLALRINVDGDSFFREVLAQVREKALAAYQNQNVPFEKVVETVNPVRTLNRTPIFQVAFNLRNLPGANFSGGKTGDLEIVPWDCDDGMAQFDLTLDISELLGSFCCRWKYSTDLFRAEDIQRLADCYTTLLSAVVADPDQRVSALPLLPEAERHKILVEWNRSATDYPRNATINQLFEEQVARLPNAIAVEFEGEKLSYLELDARANRLACHLQTFALEPDAPVGLCMERSAEMIIGLLGILRAGAAYVALDPKHPAKRLAYIIEDTRARVILTLSPLKKMVSDALVELATSCGPAVVCLDEFEKTTRKSENPAPAGAPSTGNTLACVIYTSGSTGHPKGVECPHRGVVRLVRGTNYLSFDSNEVFLQMAPLVFDASTFEIWGALLNGAKLVLMPPGMPTVDAIARVIQSAGVTTALLITGLFHVMVEERLEALKSLKQLLVGGDLLSSKHFERARRELKNCRLIHVYGPTEGTTLASYYEPRETDHPLNSVPIGRPIANSQLYVLDRQLQPLPIGVAGEIHIAGDGLARGYLNQPALTAEKFVSNPFSRDSDARLYRTGDRARYLPDGNIEFLGRVDHQVKIRGFRVELGEIEATLAKHAKIRQAVAIVAPDAPGTLVASVVAETEGTPSAEELREFLKEELPDYMIPGRFVFLKSLPLTSSGKVDRDALANNFSRDDARQMIRPQTALESQLTQIWQRSLGHGAVGTRDNFFDLGGHSLLGVQVISEINRTFDVDLGPLTLFQNPTIEQLAQTVQLQKPGRRAPALITLRNGSSESPLFLIDPGPWEFHLASLLPEETAVFGTDAPLSLDILNAASRNTGALPSLEEFAAEHVSLILNHPPTPVCFLAGYSFGGLLAFEIAHQLQRAGRRVAGVFLFDTMMRPSRRKRKGWRWFKLWSSTQLRNTRQEGFDYLVRKSTDRARYEMDKLLFALNPPRFDNSSAPVPLAAKEKIYWHTSSIYRPSPLPTQGIVFRAADNLKNIYAADRTLGWSNLFVQGVEIVDVPGGHSTFLQEPNVRVLAEKLSQILKG